MKPSGEQPLPFVERRGNERVIAWILGALALCFLGYLVASYWFLTEEHELEEIYLRQPDDPLPPEKPFIWGSRPKVTQEKREPVVPDSESADASERTESGDENTELFSNARPSEKIYGFYVGPDPKGVRRETVRALKQGAAQIWKAGADRGYVLVSLPRDYGNEECRQVSYTLFKEHEQILSPPAEWCRAKGGRWQPR